MAPALFALNSQSNAKDLPSGQGVSATVVAISTSGDCNAG